MQVSGEVPEEISKAIGDREAGLPSDMRGALSNSKPISISLAIYTHISNKVNLPQAGENLKLPREEKL